MEQTTFSALLRKTRSVAKAVALPTFLAAAATATSVFAPQAANALTVSNFNCIFGSPTNPCTPWQHGDKLVTPLGFEFAILPPPTSSPVPVQINYTWFDFNSDPLDYAGDIWELTVSSATQTTPFVGPFDLSYSYTVEIIDGPGFDSNGIAFDGTNWSFDEFGIGQNAIGSRTLSFKTVNPETGADLELTCVTQSGNPGTLCDGLKPLLSSAKQVTITDRVVMETATGLLNSVSNSWTQKEGAPVPGPLPILGAGVAFGFSRKLRRRITTAKAV